MIKITELYTNRYKIMITKFKTYESKFNCNFNYNNISDIINYLNKGCDINKIFSNEYTIAHDIVIYNLDAPEYFPEEQHNIEDADALYLIFEKGFNRIDHKNSFGETILILASKCLGYQEMVKELGEDNYWLVNIIIENGADWFITDNDNKIFMDYLSDEEKEYLKNRYPENWKKYEKYNSIKKFNI